MRSCYLTTFVANRKVSSKGPAALHVPAARSMGAPGEREAGVGHPSNAALPWLFRWCLVKREKMVLATTVIRGNSLA